MSTRFGSCLASKERNIDQDKNQLEYVEVSLNDLGYQDFETNSKKNYFVSLRDSMPNFMTWNVWRMIQNTETTTLKTKPVMKSGGYEGVYNSDCAGGCAEPLSSKYGSTRIKATEEDERERILVECHEAEEVWRATEEQLRFQIQNLEAQSGPMNTEIQKYRQNEGEYKRRIIELQNELQERRGGAQVPGITVMFDSFSRGNMNEFMMQEVGLNTPELTGVPSIGSKEFESLRKLQELVQSESAMKKRINDLEKKEKAYLKTLRKADELWMELENSQKMYNFKPEGNEDKSKAVNEFEADITHQLPSKSEEQKMLIEHLNKKEENEKCLLETISVLEREKNQLLVEIKELNGAIQTVQTELQKTKDMVEGPLTDELLEEQQRSKELQDVLDTVGKELCKASGEHVEEIKGLKDQLTKTSKELIDMENTNKGLKDEMKSLEVKISNLELSVEEQKHSAEKIVTQLSQTMQGKQNQLDKMKLTMEAQEECTGILQDVGGEAIRTDVIITPNAATAHETKLAAEVKQQITQATPLKKCTKVCWSGCYCASQRLPPVQESDEVKPIEKATVKPERKPKDSCIRPCLGECRCDAPEEGIERTEKAKSSTKEDQCIEPCSGECRCDDAQNKEVNEKKPFLAEEPLKTSARPCVEPCMGKCKCVMKPDEETQGREEQRSLRKESDEEKPISDVTEAPAKVTRPCDEPCWDGCKCDVLPQPSSPVPASPKERPPVLSEPERKQSHESHKEADVWSRFISDPCNVELEEDINSSPMTYGCPLKALEKSAQKAQYQSQSAEDMWPKFINVSCAVELEEDIDSSPMTAGYKFKPVSEIPLKSEVVEKKSPISGSPKDELESDDESNFLDAQNTPETVKGSPEVVDAQSTPETVKESPEIVQCPGGDSKQPEVSLKAPPRTEIVEDVWPRFVDNVCNIELQEDIDSSPMSYGYIQGPTASVTDPSSRECDVSPALGGKAPVAGDEKDITCFVQEDETTRIIDKDKPEEMLEGSSLQQQLQNLKCEKSQLQKQVQSLEERASTKSVEMSELKATVSQMLELQRLMERKLAGEDVDLNVTPVSQKRPMEGTASELQASLAVMQNKCRTKDQIITALANELRLRAASGVYEKLLGNVVLDEMNLPERPRDFDREQLCEYLNRPQGYEGRSPPPHPDPAADKCEESQRTRQPQTMPKPKIREALPPEERLTSSPQIPTTGEQKVKIDVKAPSPIGLEVMRRLGPDSLLIKWDVPKGTNFSGYEIFVNGSLTQKVRSPSRNKALLQSLDLDTKVVITMYVLTPNGRCPQPACLVYPDFGGEKEIQNTKYN